jgi:hypothetical protein
LLEKCKEQAEEVVERIEERTWEVVEGVFERVQERLKWLERIRCETGVQWERQGSVWEARMEIETGRERGRGGYKRLGVR